MVYPEVRERTQRTRVQGVGRMGGSGVWGGSRVRRAGGGHREKGGGSGAAG